MQEKERQEKWRREDEERIAAEQARAAAYSRLVQREAAMKQAELDRYAWLAKSPEQRQAEVLPWRAGMTAPLHPSVSLPTTWGYAYMRR